MTFMIANSADPDVMIHSIESQFGLHFMLINA